MAAFDARGEVVGAIGETCDAVDALSPLPLPLCYGFVAAEALRLGHAPAAAAAARALYRRLVDVDAASGHRLRANVVGRASLAELYAFVDCAFILADSTDNGGLPPAFASGILEPPDRSVSHEDERDDDFDRPARRELAVHGDGCAASGPLSAPAQLVQYTKVQVLLQAVEVTA